MDFSKPITIATSTSASLDLNSITASPAANTPLSGYMVDSVSYAGTPITGFIDPLAQRDGADTDIALLSPRSVQIVCQVYGSSHADFYDKLNAINAAFAPYPTFAAAVDGFRNLDFNQPTSVYSAYASTGIPMRLRVRPSALPNYGLRMTSVTPVTTDRGLAASVSVTLACKDPRKICQTPITQSLATTGTTSVTNNGNYFAYPTVRLISTGVQTVTVSTSAWTTAVAISSGTTTTLVNSTDRVVTVNGTTDMSALTTATTGLPYLEPGANTITFSTNQSGFITTLQIIFEEAWL
jgi:hypothetical protein